MIDFSLQTAVDETHMFNIAHMFSGSLANPVNPLLVLHIRRDHLVQDTLAGILRHRPHDLKKPLKVGSCFSAILNSISIVLR